MNIPGFTAEACLYGIVNHYEIQVTGMGDRGATVEAALMQQDLGLECGGSCPEGQILCKCANSCKCCTGGCNELNGYCHCERTSPLRVRGDSTSLPAFSPGNIIISEGD
jgi:hypothetical protein